MGIVAHLYAQRINRNRLFNQYRRRAVFRFRKGQNYIASGIFKAFREYKDEIEGTIKKYDDSIENQEPYKMTKEDSLLSADNKKINKIIKTDTTAEKVVTDKKVEEKEVKEVIKETKNEDKKGNEQVKQTVVYKVQLMSSDKKIPLNSDKFKNVEKPGEYMDKGIYKYTAGEFSYQQDAKELQMILRKKGFKDAFVINMLDNKRIALK